uniref:Uncharacterized protein AlNc14C24G2433 n=1 Tax=Albugo laibachii Nc14 TaxID=890382 RepID=F0W6D3_9STRA|nr:conserved hypothetical protein [Albugo laibachii Nc14]|eukprot:CCA16677.1 conserved hypothetical protein [Albugo laibachii Nc14]
MRQKFSFAGKTLLALPAVVPALWSVNASRIQRDRLEKAYTISSYNTDIANRRTAADSDTKSEFHFVTGSMDDTIMDTLQTGDLVLFSQNLVSMQPFQALRAFLLRKMHNDQRFDHCGYIIVNRVGQKSIMEETSAGVSKSPYSTRILTSNDSEIIVVPAQLERDTAFEKKAQEWVQTRSNVGPRITWFSLLSRAFHLPIRKDTPLSPAASTCALDIPTKCINPLKAFLLESYETMDLVDPVSLKDKCAITPSDWADLALRDKFAHVQTPGNISLRPKVSFGKPLPIRLS